MSKISDKPGRQISLCTIHDRERKLIQIIRNLHNTKGFLVGSGNMGWMPEDEWKAFLEKEQQELKPDSDLLINQFTR